MIDSSNFFKVAFRVLRARFGARIPLKVTQYVTYRCNLRCAFCDRYDIEAKEMSIDEIKDCMLAFKKMGTEFWGFNGGEPLLRRDIGEMVVFAKKLGFKCSISTNGIFVPERIDELKFLDLALVSIDGSEEINDIIRGKGTFRKAVKALETLKAHNIKTMINTVLNSQNIDNIDALIDLSDFYGCSLSVTPIKRVKEYFPESFKRTVNLLMEYKGKGKRISNSWQYLHELKKYPEVPKQRCWADVLFCSISPDGQVFPCSPKIYTEEQYVSGREKGWENAYKQLPDMSRCYECFATCYTEYNFILNAPFRSTFHISRNLISDNWLWQ